MKKMLSLLLPLLLAACQKELAVPRPGDAPAIDFSDHPHHGQYLAALAEYRLQTNSPGSILLIKKSGEPLWIGAVGQSNLAHQTPLRTNHAIRTASLAKTVVAAAILRLTDQGLLQMDDKLADRLPEKAGKIPMADQITIRHLLGHLSGIVDPLNDRLDYQLQLVNNPATVAAMSEETLMKRYVYGEPLHFPPGSRYAYSNTNYWLLGQILSKTTGKTLQSTLEELVFAPLAMTGAYIDRRDDRQVARTYTNLPGNNKLMDVTDWDRAELDGRASSGLVCTPEDLYRLLDGLFNGNFLMAESLEQMKRIQWGDCDNITCEYGLGLEVYRTGAGLAYGNNGTTKGLEANMVYYPETGNMIIIWKNNGVFSDKSRLFDLVE